GAAGGGGGAGCGAAPTSANTRPRAGGSSCSPRRRAMLDNERLRARLGELVRDRRAAALSAPRSEIAGRRRSEGVGVEAFLPGGEWRDEGGAVFVHERLRSEIERRRPHWGRLGEPPEAEADLRALSAAGLARALFLDLETGGLASSPVFLAGTMHWNGEDFVLRQYFARHYGEESALLRAVAEFA